MDASPIITLPPMDSDDLAEICRRDSIMPRHIAAELGQSAVAAARAGVYQDTSVRPVVWRDAVNHAVAARISLPHDHPLPPCRPPRHDSTIIQVANETTMVSAQRAQTQGLRPLALNFANGIHPGGGFLKPLWTSAMLSKTNSAVLSPMPFSPSPTGHRIASFSVLFVTYSAQTPPHFQLLRRSCPANESSGFTSSCLPPLFLDQKISRLYK